ncbi:hypothetical protein BpHYR1_021240 [Brachionus plicatilis]|uniref:Uncharacterized protein n=1 Tax=Brachionus plicatilis TaxID=10195 RepID=A0A3M7T5G4_BRAPC|nr:hypothetical protein BpHYR1_021240 [Brachionus plicatilis]
MQNLGNILTLYRFSGCNIEQWNTLTKLFFILNVIISKHREHDNKIECFHNCFSHKSIEKSGLLLNGN